MDKEYQTLVGRVSWQDNGDELKVEFRNHRYKLKWNQITRAGSVELPESGTLPELLVDALPGTGEVLDLFDQMQADHRQLIIARGWSESRLIRLPLPTGNPEAEHLVEQIKSHIGERWVGEVDFKHHQEALGLGMPKWYLAMILLGFVVIAFLVLQVISAIGALAAGEVYRVPGLVWLMLILLAMLIVYWVYQSRFQG
jgi:hypothetical protein